ncbi:MAG: hypothetical protein ACREIT_01995 [Tepidisphaeraceae bacterium]
MARDPVCDKFVGSVESGRKGLMSVYGDHAYYFCSRQCKQEFDARPAEHLKEKPTDLYGCPVPKDPPPGSVVSDEPPTPRGTPFS